ncbi:hypothetical protein Tco_0921631 [Tanacetum coccineum]
MGCTDCSHLALGWFRKTTLYSTYQDLVYLVGEPSSWVRPDGLQVVKPPNMNFRIAGRPKNTNRNYMKEDDEKRSCFCASYNLISDIGSVTYIVSVVTQVVVAVVVVKGEDAPLECVRTHSDSIQPRLKRSRETRQESNIHVDLGGHSQEYEVAYTNNYVRSQEYEAAYTNNYVRSQEYEAAYTNNYYEATYTNNYVSTQEYEAAYNNMDGGSQGYRSTYNNMNGSSQGYEAAYTNFNSMFEQANINFGGQSQHPLPTMSLTFS